MMKLLGLFVRRPAGATARAVAQEPQLWLHSRWRSASSSMERRPPLAATTTATPAKAHKLAKERRQPAKSEDSPDSVHL
jgi:hypothetical protein